MANHSLQYGNRDEKRDGHWLGEVCIYFPKLAMNATTGCSYCTFDHTEEF